MKQHYDAVVARLPREIRGYLPYVAAGFCDETQRADVEAFFGPRAPKLEGGTRNLAQTLETISLCVALKQAQQPNVSRFLESY